MVFKFWNPIFLFLHDVVVDESSMQSIMYAKLVPG